MTVILRPGQRILQIPGIGVQTSRRAVGGGNGLLNSLIAYWPLNEAAGANNALDLHTNGLTLTQVHSPGSAAGIVYPGARTFDGANDYFNRASEALLQTGDVDFTFAAWVYHAALTADHGIFGKFPNGDVVLRYQNSTNRWRMVLGNAAGGAAAAINAVTFGAPSLNTWYLLMTWYDATEGKIYISVNNGAADSAAKTSAPTTSTVAFTIGLGVAAFMNGRIGPVAFWKSAAGGGGVLSAAQRTALWNAGAGLPYASFTV